MEISNLRWWCHLKVNACSMTSRLRQQKRISLWFFLFPQRVQLMLSASGQRSKLQQEGGGLTLSCGQRWFSFSKCVKVRKRWQNSCLTAVLKPRGRDWRRGGGPGLRGGGGGRRGLWRVQLLVQKYVRQLLELSVTGVILPAVGSLPIMQNQTRRRNWVLCPRVTSANTVWQLILEQN